MNHTTLILLAALVTWTLTSCAPKDASLTAEQLAFCELEGKETAQTLGKNLLAQLEGALDSGDLTAAITVCQTAAQPITAATSQERPGVTIRRTSLKHRNPANTPDELDREVLESWESAQEIVKGLVRQTGPSSARFYTPILIKDACLKCHGSRELMPEFLTKTLNTLYPDDLAHGYALGDLRGAFRVDIDLTKAIPKS